MHAVATWPSGQLWWGAKSLAELGDSVLQSVVHEPNGHPLNPWLLVAAGAIQPWIVPVLVLTAAVAAFSARRDWRVRYASVVSGALAIAVAAHWVVFKLDSMLLPKERTAIWTVVLGTAILVSACTAARQRWIRGVGTGMLTLAAVYFLGCLRLSYFKEWHWNAGTRIGHLRTTTTPSD